MSEEKVKLKDKIKRAFLSFKNSESKKYIIFVAIVVPIILLFVLSGVFMSKDDKSNTLNYNTSVSLLNYNMKVSYATYNTDTHTFEFTWFVTDKMTSNSSSVPQIYSIASSSDLDKFIEYESNKLSDTATRVVAENVDNDFDYIRVYFSSKAADTVVEDKYDDFGDFVEGYTIEGEESYLEVRIDRKDIQIIDNAYAATSTVVTFENIEQPEDDNTTTVADSMITYTSAEEDNVPKETTSSSTTTAAASSSKETETTVKSEVITAKTTAATTSTVTTPISKTTTTTTTKATTSTTTTTTKSTTTTSAIVVQPPVTQAFVETHGLKISCSKAANGIISMQTSETAQLVPVFTPENATYRAVKWSSTDSNVASVDNNGKVMAVSKGSCIIKCTTTQGAIFEVGIMIKVY